MVSNSYYSPVFFVWMSFLSILSKRVYWANSFSAISNSLDNAIDKSTYDLRVRSTSSTFCSSFFGLCVNKNSCCLKRLFFKICFQWTWGSAGWDRGKGEIILCSVMSLKVISCFRRTWTGDFDSVVRHIAFSFYFCTPSVLFRQISFRKEIRDIFSWYRSKLLGLSCSI